MEKLMTGAALADKAVDCARNFKTLYVLGAFGWPMTEEKKKRCQNPDKKPGQFNLKADRAAKIVAATADTFGFDCVCFIKALLWGWVGDPSKTYGGAVYLSNGVPEMDESGMINKCTDVTTDFATVQVGEVVWNPGHIGIYVGDGLAVECTYAWDDGVQVTRVWNMISNDGTPGRYWTKHGKLPWIQYESEPVFRVTIENVPKSRAAELVREGAERGWTVNVEAMEVAEVTPEQGAEGTPGAEAKFKHDIYKRGLYRANVKEFLRMRSGAGLDKPILRTLKPNEIVICHGDYVGEWLKVETEDGTEGFCHESYLVMQIICGEEALYSSGKKGSYRINVKEWLNMRAGPSLEKTIICKLKPGDLVKCYGFYADAWLCVVAPDGTVGYCHQGYLDKV